MPGNRAATATLHDPQRRAVALGCRCSSCPFRDRRPVFAEANKNPLMVVLGESPGRTEVRTGRPFDGDSGEFLDRIFEHWGIPRSRCHVTNAVLCFVPGTMVEARGIVKAYRRDYSGTIVKLTTRSGNVLTGTPNHPILTLRGWVALGKLHKGDHLVRSPFSKGAIPRDPDVHDGPIEIEQLFGALAQLGGCHRRACTEVDFHGDAGAWESKIDVVSFDSILWRGGEATGYKQLAKDILEPPNLREAFGSRSSAPTIGASLGGSGSLCSSPRPAGCFGECLPSVGAHALIPQTKRLFEVADLNPHTFEMVSHSRVAQADLLGKRCRAATFPVAADEVVHVERLSYSGHVYNLQTVSNWYVSQGYVAHNCHPEKATPADWKAAIAACRPRLEAELPGITSTTTVLALGGRALDSFAGRKGMFDWIGAPVAGLPPFERFTALPSLHPAFVLRPDGRPYAPHLYIHIGRAWQLACGKLPAFRWPDIFIEPDEKALAALKRIQKRGGPIGFDVETRGKDPMAAPLMSLAIADDKDAVSLPWERYTAKGGESVRGIGEYPLGKELQRVCRAIIENEKIEKVLQNGQHDILSCERLGWQLKGYAFDCLLAHSLLLSGARHDLGAMAAIEFSADRWKSYFHVSTDSKGLDAFVKRDPRDLRRYNAKDAAMTLLLRAPLERRLQQANNGPALNADYLRRAKLALMMRRRGVPVDVTKFARHRKRISKQRGIARKELREIAMLFGYSQPPKDNARLKELTKLIGRCRWVARKTDGLLQWQPESAQVSRWKKIRSRAKKKLRGFKEERDEILEKLSVNPFNPNSGRHLADLFFTHLKCVPSTFSLKTNAPKLDEDALSRLATHPNTIVSHASRALLRYRRWNKLLSTYIDGMPIDSNNLAHPTWNVAGTRTQRWSSQDPNAMNIPGPVIKMKPDGSKYIVRAGLRDLFVGFPGAGHFGFERNWVVEADYSQLELRIIAQLSNDEPLLTAYQNGVDVHTVNARDLFGLPQDSPVPKAMRHLAKTFAYAANYGGAAETIWKSISIDFPHVTLLQIEKMLYLWFVKHPAIRRWQDTVLKQVRLHDYNEAPLSGHRAILYGLIDPKKVYNWPVQHTGADIINPRMEKVSARLRWPSEGILFQCHDALVVDGPDPLRLAKILKEELTAEITLGGSKMNYPVDVKVGLSWGEAEEVKELKEIPALCKKLVAKHKQAVTLARASVIAATKRAPQRSTTTSNGIG